jgi:hypothetical protein
MTRLEELQAKRDSIVDKLARGVARTRSGDQEVQNFGAAELEKALNRIDYEISLLQPRTSRTSYATFSKG